MEKEFLGKEEVFIKTLSKLEAFEEISNALRVSPFENDFSKIVVGAVVKGIGGVGGSIMLLNEFDFLERIAAIGSHIGEDFFLKTEEQLCRQALKKGTSVAKRVNFGKRNASLYFLAEPIYHREPTKSFGAMIVESLRPFSKEDSVFIKSIASQVGVAIANSRLTEKMKLETTEFLSLVEIGTAISSELDLEKLLSLVVHTAAQLVRSEVAILLLINKETNKLKRRAAYGLGEVLLSNRLSKSEQIISEHIIKFAAPLLVSDVRKNSRFRNLSVGRRKVKSLIAVPLKAKDETIGVLVVENVSSDYKFESSDLDLLIILAGQAATAISNAELYSEMRELYVSTIKSLVSAAEIKDVYQKGHSDRVTQYAVKLAKAMGLADEEVENIRYAGILHDIGKIGIPEAILLKPGPLTPEERRVIENHSVLSAKIIEPIKFLRDALTIVLHHHERYDGKGYTDELAGEDIPIGARILAVADAYEAMTSDRPYRAAMKKEEAIEELKRYAGTQFDPKVVKVFVSLFKQNKI